MLGNDRNKPELHAQTNLQYINSGKYLLPFSPEFAQFSFVSRNINVTLHPALNGCETWSLTVTEEHRLRMLEKNRVPREMREEVTVE
jgi:hypothetical protein